MVKLTYRLPDGSSSDIEASAGENLMTVATNHDIQGIVGQCGGYRNCGTCHIYVDERWASLLPEPSEEEEAMLSESAAELQPTSRLSCQVKLTEALDGIIVTVPETQEF